MTKIEDAFGVLVFLVVISQVLLPMWQDKLLFPMFRKRTAGAKQAARARERHGEAIDMEEAAEIEEKAKKVETRTNDLRSKG
jgi:hypothetical protein